LGFIALNAFAEDSKPHGTLIDFSAQAQRSAANDLGNAMMYFEADGDKPGELARRVNQVIANALATAKNQSEVKVKSGSSNTYPVYAKNSRTIESWRMRSELLLESRDATALSELLGKLQSSLAVGSLYFGPAPDTLRKIDDATAMDALAVFQEKAARYAAALGKPYRIVSINIGSNGVSPAPTRFDNMRMKSAMSAAAPMPTEAGESQIIVNVNGQIELLDSPQTTKTP
jgi:predicted secreted protein